MATSIDLQKTTRESTQQLNRTYGSFELAFAPVIMALIGLWIDRSVGLLPVFTITLAVLGAVGVAVKIYYSYRYEMAGHAERLNELRAGRRPSENRTAVDNKTVVASSIAEPTETVAS